MHPYRELPVAPPDPWWQKFIESTPVWIAISILGPMLFTVLFPILCPIIMFLDDRVEKKQRCTTLDKISNDS